MARKKRRAADTQMSRASVGEVGHLPRHVFQRRAQPPHTGEQRSANRAQRHAFGGASSKPRLHGLFEPVQALAERRLGQSEGIRRPPAQGFVASLARPGGKLESDGTEFGRSLAQIAANKRRTYDYLLRVSMIASLRRAQELG